MTENITFKGFSPPPKLVRAFDLTLNWLRLGFPKDASIAAEIRRVGLIYQCGIEIASESGSFGAHALGGSPLNALDSTVFRAKTKWRKLI